MQYVFTAIAAVTLLIIFLLVPLRINKQLLLKVVVISFLNFTLSILLYSLYSLFIALLVLLFLCVYFTIVVAKQERFYQSSPEMKSRENVNYIEKKDTISGHLVHQPKKILPPAVVHLDQDSIDQLIKTVEEVAVSIETPSSEASETSNSIEHNTNLVDYEKIEIIKPIQIEHVEENLQDEMNKPTKSFSKEDKCTAESVLSEISLEEEDESSLDDLEVIFEGRSRLVTLETDDDETNVESDSDLLIYDRGLIDEIQIEITPQTVDKKLEELGKTERDAEDLKNNILKKREKMFKDLEKD